jgi:hypothetical protein
LGRHNGRCRTTYRGAVATLLSELDISVGRLSSFGLDRYECRHLSADELPDADFSNRRTPYAHPPSTLAAQSRPSYCQWSSEVLLSQVACADRGILKRRLIGAHRQVFGVVPIGRVLSEHGWPIASSTYRAAKTRLPTVRLRRDEQLNWDSLIVLLRPTDFRLYVANPASVVPKRTDFPYGSGICQDDSESRTPRRSSGGTNRIESF